MGSHSNCGWKMEAPLNLALPPLQSWVGVLTLVIIYGRRSLRKVKKKKDKGLMDVKTQTRERRRKTGEKSRKLQRPRNGDCISLRFNSSDMALDRAINSLSYQVILKLFPWSIYITPNFCLMVVFPTLCSQSIHTPFCRFVACVLISSGVVLT